MIKTETVEYREGGTVLEGFVSYDDASSARRPGVMIVPEWYGVTAFTKKIGDRIAALGYLAFGVNVYGKGIRPASVESAQKESEPYYQDRMLLRRRGNAGLVALRAQKLLDQGKVAGIGYCFGGITLLEMARGGADFGGLVAFHTQLMTSTPAPANPGAIKPKVAHPARRRGSDRAASRYRRFHGRNAWREGGLAVLRLWQRNALLHKSRLAARRDAHQGHRLSRKDR